MGKQGDPLPELELRARPPQGQAFGFQITSELPFRYLRSPSTGVQLSVKLGEPATEQTEPGEVVQEWAAIPGKRNRTVLRVEGPRLRVIVGSEHWFVVDPEAETIFVSDSPHPLRREMLFFGTPAALYMTMRGDLALHASAVEVEGRAVLLAAPGTFGKTTLAAAFCQHGFRVISDDLSCCDPATGVVKPGPAVLRVRQDAYLQIGELPDTSVAYEDVSKVHLSLEGEARGDGREIPVCAVLLLRTDGARMAFEVVPPDVALRDLWAVSFSRDTDAARIDCFSGLADLVSRVPVWNFIRPMNFDNLSFAVAAIAEKCAR